MMRFHKLRGKVSFKIWRLQRGFNTNSCSFVLGLDWVWNCGAFILL